MPSVPASRASEMLPDEASREDKRYHKSHRRYKQRGGEAASHVSSAITIMSGLTNQPRNCSITAPPPGDLCRLVRWAGVTAV